jgi:hypothetical protein
MLSNLLCYISSVVIWYSSRERVLSFKSFWKALCNHYATTAARVKTESNLSELPPAWVLSGITHELCCSPTAETLTPTASTRVQTKTQDHYDYTQSEICHSDIRLPEHDRTASFATTGTPHWNMPCITDNVRHLYVIIPKRTLLIIYSCPYIKLYHIIIQWTNNLTFVECFLLGYSSASVV